MIEGKPKCRKTCWKKRSATSGAVTVVTVGIALIVFDSLSMTTKIASCPFLVGGNWVMKSIVTTSHFLSGIGRGYNIPAAFWYDGLFLWHSSHEFTYSLVSLTSVGQKNCLRIS